MHELLTEDNVVIGEEGDIVISCYWSQNPQELKKQVISAVKLQLKIEKKIEQLEQIISENTPVNSRVGGIEDLQQELDYLKKLGEDSI